MAKRYETNEEETKSKPVERVYSVKELIEFDVYMQENKTIVTELLNDEGEKIVLYDWDKVYFEQGAKNKKGEVIVKDVEYGKNRQGEVHMIKNTIPLLELENKIEQWKSWRGRQQYIERKQLEQLEATYQTIGGQF